MLQGILSWDAGRQSVSQQRAQWASHWLSQWGSPLWSNRESLLVVLPAASPMKLQVTAQLADLPTHPPMEPGHLAQVVHQLLVLPQLLHEPVWLPA